MLIVDVLGTWTIGMFTISGLAGIFEAVVDGAGVTVFVFDGAGVAAFVANGVFNGFCPCIS